MAGVGIELFQTQTGQLKDLQSIFLRDDCNCNHHHLDHHRHRSSPQHPRDSGDNKLELPRTPHTLHAKLDTGDHDDDDDEDDQEGHDYYDDQDGDDHYDGYDHENPYHILYPT